LSQAPLLQVAVAKLKEEEYILMVDLHHIISDGISHDILVQDFMSLYGGEELPALKLQYKEYSEWQSSEKEREVIKQQEEFWLKEFKGEIPVLELPTDYLRPPLQSFAGSTLNFGITGKDTRALKKLALEEGGTLYMLLLAIYNIFLSKISNREVIVIGTPSAGRHHADLEQVIGMFVNTLALKNYPAGEKRFIEFLGEVKERTVEAFANQGYQYEELVEAAAVTRDTGRNPLFDTMFILQNMDMVRVDKPGLKLEPYIYKQGTSKFDLTLTCVELARSLSFTVGYSTKLFKEETIKRFIRYFNMILASVLENPAVKLLDLDIVPAEEKRQLLYEFNYTDTDYPGDKPIQALFDEQVEKVPDRTAVVFEEESITYSELKRRADSLAVFLYTKGSKEEDAVGIMMKRCLEMVIGVLGILKGGGCYLPINIKYPQKRKTFILNDSRSRILLTDEALSSASHGLEVIDLCSLEYEALPTGETDDAASGGSANDHTAVSLAYIIYTSGSTGNPKGVMVEHKNVVRLVKNTNYIDFPEEYKLLPTGALEFDASTFEGCTWSTKLQFLHQKH